MIYSFTYGIYIFLLTLLCGTLINKGLAKFWDVENKTEVPSFFRVLILGLIGTSSFTAAVAFFYPVDVFVHMFFVLFVAAGTAINKNEILPWLGHYLKRCRQYKIVSVILVLIFVISISEAAALVSVDDSGYYHIPLVKWLNEYGLVKGLANLQDSFGFMSGWFYYASLFDFGMFDDLTYHMLNALAFTWGWSFVAVMFIRFKEGSYGAKDFLIIPVSVYLCSKVFFIASISPQLIVSLSAFWVIYESLSFADQKPPTSGQLGYLFLIAIFSVFLKLSAVPVLLFLLVPSVRYLNSKIKTGKLPAGEVIKVTSPALILLGIFFSQNIILTGYPVYPVAALDIFNVDWKVPENEVTELVGHIKNFGIRHYYYLYGAPESLDFNWLFEWITLNLNRAQRTVTVICFIFLPVSIMFSLLILLRAQNKTVLAPWIITLFVLIASLLIWFFSSFNFRFGAVWIMTTLFFPLALCMVLRKESVKPYLPASGVIYSLLLIVCLYFFVGRAKLLFRTAGDGNYLITWVLDIYTPEYRQIEIADGTTINVPADNKQPPQPLDIPLPSVGQELVYEGDIDTAIERRGPSLADGFKPAVKVRK